MQGTRHINSLLMTLLIRLNKIKEIAYTNTATDFQQRGTLSGQKINSAFNIIMLLTKN